MKDSVTVNNSAPVDARVGKPDNPNRDVDAYVRAARAEGLAIRNVTETHIHADFASVSRELAKSPERASISPPKGGPDWQYPWGCSPPPVSSRSS